MTTFVLVMYLSTFAGNFTTGGPAVIDGFTSLEKCEAARDVVKTIQKFDWSHCVKVAK